MRCGSASGASACRPVASRSRRCARTRAAKRSVNFTVASEDDVALQSGFVQPAGAARARERITHTPSSAPRTAAAALSLEAGDELDIAALEARLHGESTQRTSTSRLPSAKRDKRSVRLGRAQLERDYKAEWPSKQAHSRNATSSSVPSKPKRRRAGQRVSHIAREPSTWEYQALIERQSDSPEADRSSGHSIVTFLEGLEKELPQLCDPCALTAASAFVLQIARLRFAPG